MFEGSPPCLILDFLRWQIKKFLTSLERKLWWSRKGLDKNFLIAAFPRQLLPNHVSVDKPMRMILRLNLQFAICIRSGQNSVMGILIYVCGT